MTCFSASTFLGKFRGPLLFVLSTALTASRSGPTVGPVISGFVNQNANWRITWYALLGWGGVELCLLVLFVPETLLDVVLKSKAKRLRKAGRTEVKVSRGSLKHPSGRSKPTTSFAHLFQAPIELDRRSIAAVLRVSCTQPFGESLMWTSDETMNRA